MSYLKIKSPLLYLFIIPGHTTRNHGGLNVAIPETSIDLVQDLINELKQNGQDFSRKVPIFKEKPELPEHIFPGMPFKFLETLRMGHSDGNRSRFVYDSSHAELFFSDAGLNNFSYLLQLIKKGDTDISCSDDTGSRSGYMTLWRVETYI